MACAVPDRAAASYARRDATRHQPTRRHREVIDAGLRHCNLGPDVSGLKDRQSMVRAHRGSDSDRTGLFLVDLLDLADRQRGLFAFPGQVWNRGLSVGGRSASRRTTSLSLTETHDEE